MKILIVVDHTGIVDTIHQTFGSTDDTHYVAWGQCPAIGPFDLILVPRPNPDVMKSEVRKHEIAKWQSEWLTSRLAPGGRSRIYHI